MSAGRPCAAAVRRGRRSGWPAGWALVLGLIAPAALALEVVDPGQGPVPVGIGPDGEPPRELSALTHVGGERYFAAGDKGGRIQPLRIRLDLRDGRVLRARVGRPRSVPGAVDLEGIAWLPSSGTLLVCDEFGPALSEVDPASGRALRRWRLPGLLRRARRNRGLESLSLEPGSGCVWTATEEALRGDGPLSTPRRGTVVRLVRFRPDGTPAGQWAYTTDPVHGEGAALAGHPRSGLVELLALPGGALLALERSLGSRGLRVRIYRVERAGATEISEIGELAGARFTPVRRELLFEWRGASNFEGMALGPRLEGGDRALLLLSDDGPFSGARVLALRLRGLPEEGPGRARRGGDELRCRVTAPRMPRAGSGGALESAPPRGASKGWPRRPALRSLGGAAPLGGTSGRMSDVSGRGPRPLEAAGDRERRAAP